MGRNHRVANVLFLAGVALGCRRAKPNDVATPPVASVPADRLGPGEAAPGQEKAHDLLLPRGGKIDRVFGKSVYAWVPSAPESVANYIRTQTDEEVIAIVGPSATVFPKLKVRGALSDHWLRVEISSDKPDSTNLIIDRVDDKPPPPAGKSNAELMKEVGLTPDGKILDPKRIE